MEELSISNNDLEKKLKTRYFPKNLTSLELKNNSIQSLCGYFDLPRLNQVDLSNNKLKNFPWWFLLHPMEKVNFSNNEIEVLCSPAYWLRIKYLNLSNNKISAIELSDNEDDDENIVVQGSPGVHLNLSGNNLTFLPLKFEKIIQIVSLNLSKNKFEYETAEECLYQRLPLVLKKLNISDMPLFTLSCTLCYRMLEELTASNCQLRYICPKIFHQFVETESESFDVQRNLKLDISNNSDLEGLPFVPETIIPYPKKHDKISKSLIFWRRKEATKNTLRILTSPSLQNTQRLAFKMEFNSLKDAKNDKYYCKCCAKCGNPTKKHVIQQIMTMDLELFEKTENKSILNYWAPETWKANIITKLCDSCENDCKNAAKETLISRKRKQQKEKKNAKKQHVVTIVPQQNITDVEMKESSQYYPDSGGCSSQTAPISIQAATSSQTMPPYSYTNINEPMDCDYPSTQSSQNMQQMRFPINFDPNYMVPPQQTLYTSFISLPSQEYVYGYNSELQQHNEIQNMDTIIPQNNDTYHQQHLDTNPPIIMPRYEYYDPTVDNDYFIKL